MAMALALATVAAAEIDMAMKIRRIQIDFPEAVTLDSEQQQRLVEIVTEITEAYECDHPARTYGETSSDCKREQPQPQTTGRQHADHRGEYVNRISV